MSPETIPAAETFSPIRWDHGLKLLDQTRLPSEEVWLDCATPEDVAAAIYRLSVRGAPAIGVSAAYGLVVGLETKRDDQTLDERFEEVAEFLGATRPTAVNLRWAIDKGREIFAASVGDGDEGRIAALLEWAKRVHREDIESCRRIGAFGAELFRANDRVLTHCNTGALATGGYGTALGVIQSSFDQGKISHVWVDETRPLLQGARLTAWELGRLGIPYKLVTDSSVGSLMSRGLVERVVLGADRIAANGDTANKIGTYTVAVMANRHGVPFYVAAPLSTIDPATPTGNEIPIEERSGDEVTDVFGAIIAPENAPAANFAFDVTPHELVTAIITDVGVLEPPFTEAIALALASQKS
ncbi:MAG: S-methyl-5-thioribose-1-phosphate isomerase [Acidobacteriota bacterium]|nr:S-methyl-5-thioribose-1-phosphate isomerase [Acidobacteriota bacterium]